MTTQPFLTDFPSTIFATARRQAQARLRHCREQLTRRSISGYSLLFEDFLHPEFLAGIDPTRRQRSFGHIPVFWAWAGQILEGNASCSKAVGLIQSWCRALKIPAPNGDTGAYCQARKRIQDGFLDAVHEELCRGLGRATGGRDLWHGMTLKAIDGSSVTLMDTPENQARYPQHSASKDGCGFPIMGIVGLVNLSHGGWESIACCDSKKHDSSIAPGLLPQITSDDLLLADRAFCSYEFVARLTTEREGHIVIRLHQSRQRKLDWRRGKKIGPVERLVRWEKPRAQPPGSTLTKEQWAALPDGITLRYIKCSYTDRAGERSTLVVVTDLLDPDEHGAEELLDLYRRRWEIEVKLRDVKTTLRMESLGVKTPEMAHKTIKMMMIAYNLIRGVMIGGAAEAGKPTHHMSFKGTLDVVTSSHEGFRATTGKPRSRRALYREFIGSCAQRTLNIRPGRQEPRAVKRRPKSYQRLTKPRRIFREVPHRETHYRK